MANQVEELVVAAKPQGMDEVSDGLKGMREDFQETADEMDDTTEQFGELQDKWVGLMGVLAGGIAFAVGNVVSNIPILGSALDGLRSIMQALGLQVDQLLRDLGAEGLVNVLFMAGSAIANLGGIIGDLVGSITVVLGALTAYAAKVGAAAALSSGSLTTGFSAAAGVFSTFGSILATVASGVATVASALAGLISLPAVIIAAVAALAAAFALNIGGIRTKTIQVVKDVWSWVENLASGLVSRAARVARAAGNVASGIVDAFTDKVDNAVQWGKDFIDNLIQGIKSKIGELTSVISDVESKITSKLSFDIAENDRAARRWGSDLLQEFSAGVDQGARELGVPDPTDMSSRGTAFRAERREQPTVIMNGRELTKQDGRFRDDDNARRGNSS